MEVTRDRAWETLTRYTKSEALLRHALAVEASVGWYARHFGEDEQLWRATALLHDFDYEIHPTLDARRSCARKAGRRRSSRACSPTPSICRCRATLR
jgi:predicted hydrolase (HD superfamily)